MSRQRFFLFRSNAFGSIRVRINAPLLNQHVVQPLHRPIRERAFRGSERRPHAAPSLRVHVSSSTCDSHFSATCRRSAPPFHLASPSFATFQFHAFHASSAPSARACGLETRTKLLHVHVDAPFERAKWTRTHAPGRVRFAPIDTFEAKDLDRDREERGRRRKVSRGGSARWEGTRGGRKDVDRRENDFDIASISFEKGGIDARILPTPSMPFASKDIRRKLEISGVPSRSLDERYRWKGGGRWTSTKRIRHVSREIGASSRHGHAPSGCRRVLLGYHTHVRRGSSRGDAPGASEAHQKDGNHVQETDADGCERGLGHDEQACDWDLHRAVADHVEREAATKTDRMDGG